MKAIILAAGRGSRLNELTVTHPKCLTMLGGRTLLEWQLKAIREAGIHEIAIVRGYLGAALSPFLTEFFDNPQWSTSNMVRSLWCASQWLESDDCLVSYSDIVYPAETVGRLVSCTGEIAVTYDRQWQKLWTMRFGDPLIDSESFRCNDQGVLVEIGNRPKTLEDVQGQYMGLLKFTPSGWRNVASTLTSLDSKIIDKLDMTSLLRRLIEQNLTIHALPVDGKFYEVDNLSDLNLYDSLLKNGESWLTR